MHMNAAEEEEDLEAQLERELAALGSEGAFEQDLFLQDFPPHKDALASGTHACTFLRNPSYTSVPFALAWHLPAL